MRTTTSVTEADPVQQLGDARGRRQQHEGQGAGLAGDLELGVEDERQLVGVAVGGQDAGHHGAEHVAGRLRRTQVELEAGHGGQGADVGADHDVADLTQRRAPGVGVGLDAEHGAEGPRIVVADHEQRRRVDLA
jgi:hypothetical protein